MLFEFPRKIMEILTTSVLVTILGSTVLVIVFVLWNGREKE
jgi:hypothetical protein